MVNITRETTNIIHHHHQYEGNNGVPNTHNHQPDEGSSATPTTRHLQQSVGSNSVPSHHQRNERNDSEPSQHQRNERNDALPSPPRSRNTLPAIAASAPQFPSEDNDYQENYFIESQQPRPDMQSRPVQRSVLPSITQYAHSSDGYHPSNVDHSINNAGLPSYSDIISSQQKQ